MAQTSLANLNVRLGFVFDQKSLTRVERQLRSTGDRLARTGSNISLFISAPLALLGSGAIKAAGEFESLRLAMEATFKNAGRTVEEARAEVEALRKAALAPGLDFQQAVSASIRLQSVGLSAENARNTIQELANAIASTGGTADNLSSVTVQMAQMISKGKVLSQDLRIIQENLPIISDLMLKAFGTANAEKIQELGITGKDFVKGITAEMTKLTRAQGGISNALVNAGSAIKQALAGVGEEIARVLNIGALSDRFAAALHSIVEGFKGLSDGTKKAIVYVGLFLAALGPVVAIMGGFFSVASIVVKGLGAINNAIAFVVQGFRAMGDAVVLSFGIIDTSLAGFQAALGRLKIALGIVGIVAGLAIAFYSLADNFNAAEFAAQKFSDAQAEVISSTSKEIGLVNQNFAALKDETKSRFEKGKAVDALLKQYPQYLKGIDLEKASVSQLTEIQNGLNQSILRGVAERQKASAVQSIYEKQASTLLRIQQLRDGANATASEGTLVDTGDVIKAGGIVEAVIAKLQQRSADLGNQVNVVAGQFDKLFNTIGGATAATDPALKAEYDLRDAYYKEKDAIEENSKATKKHVVTKGEITAAQKEHNAALREAKELEADEVDKLEKYAKMVREIEQAWLDEAAADSAARAVSAGATDTTGTAPTLDAQPLDLGVNLESVTAATTALEFMRTTMAGLNEGTVAFNDTFSLVAENIAANGDKMQQVFLGVAEGVTAYANEGGTSLKGFALEAAASAAKVVRSFIMQGVAAAASKALTAVPFPFNILAGAAAGALAGTLFNKLLQGIGLPKFAKGTRDAPGGLSLVGEKGPEFVNLPRHSQVFPAHQTSSMLNDVGGASAVSLSGEFSVRGSDLILVLDRVQQKQTRQR